LARHQIALSDGHMAGISVAGHGIPLVVVHGFSAEGFLYAQTLSRLVSMGFKVIAVDTAGHGNTQGLPYDGQDLTAYSELLGRIVDELGLEQYILAGHSMGGRLVTQLAADRPDQVIAVLLIDAIVGDTWDKMVYLFRMAPPLLAAVGAALAVDTASVLPLFRDPKQAAKLIRLVTPTLAGHVVRPWRLAGPMISILRSRSSRYVLNELAHREMPVFAIHGSHDLPVPLRTARETAARTHGTLVTVEKAGHSWILRDPETLPAIVGELMEGDLGVACAEALARRGVRRRNPTPAALEAACCAPDARILALTPHSDRTTTAGRHGRPRYSWTVAVPDVTEAAAS
jgi:pimeloyl-ACP methyl ester carboxylesterase